MNENLNEKIKELRKGYLCKLEDSLQGFKVLINNDLIDVQDIYLKVHTISGTSGMYGLKELSDISTEFEFYLKPLKENQSPVNIEEFKKYFLNYINCIEKTLLVGE